MKLIELTPEYVREQTKKPKAVPPPSITFCHNMIRMNKTLCDALDIQPGQGIVMVQDAERPKDLYLMFKIEGGFPVRQLGSTTEMRFNCSYYWNLVRELFEVEGRAVKFRVAITPSKLNQLTGYAILTIEPLPLTSSKKGKASTLPDANAKAQEALR